jgi:hypothetical protein
MIKEPIEERSVFAALPAVESVILAFAGMELARERCP